jgi:hypothetical protein
MPGFRKGCDINDFSLLPKNVVEFGVEKITNNYLANHRMLMKMFHHAVPQPLNLHLPPLFPGAVEL